MTSLLVTPELGKSLVWKRGILTMPKEDATVSCDCVARKPCRGLVVRDLPLEAGPLQRYVEEMGRRFIDRQRVRGCEFMGEMRLHGPWESYEFNKTLTYIEDAAWKRAEQESNLSHVLPFVIERNGTSPYSDYVLLGNFLARNVLTEVVVKEEKDG